jgi:anti-sigma-K factor RskA
MAVRRADQHTLAGPYALDALPERDRARFERHLAACQACAQEVRGLREAAARLAAATATAPPARLREQVLARVARTRQVPPVQEPAGPAVLRGLRPRRGAARRVGLITSRRLGARGPVAVALSGALLVALAAAVVFGVIALTVQHRLSQAEQRDHLLAAVLTAPDAKMMTAPVTGGGSATIIMSHRAHALAFSSAGLPALPAGKSYELWLMGPPRDRSAAMLPRAAHGMTPPVVATGLQAGDKIELTVEPSGGAPRPTTPPILLVVT